MGFPGVANCLELARGGSRCGGTKDLARYVTFSRCICVTRSSKFKGCDFFLDESQFLNCVYFMLMFVSFEQCLYVIRL
ncbi:hypothetical protein HanIR_Chr03g0114051 [Helianthus annuus]|nr:hypothetical protein HanIR_Chr03g0114051 [Helianthus annuus]